MKGAPRGLGFLLALLLSSPVPEALGAEEALRLEEGETSLEGRALLSVRVFAAPRREGWPERELIGAFDGAEIFLNRVREGSAPLLEASLEPGTYLIGVEAPGYRSREYLILLKERRSYELAFTLEARTGFLELRIEPPDAEILVEGESLRGSLLELPVGERRLLIRRFGYRDREARVLLPEGERTVLELSLEPAPFSVSELRSSRRRFNPANAGSLGRARLSFEVSSFGSARLEIRDAGGGLVLAEDFPSFSDWAQGLTWTGRDSVGAPLPDGSYRVRLEAFPAASGASAPAARGPEPLVRELALELDSALAASPFGSAGGLAGLRHFPEPELAPAGISSLELGWTDPPGGAPAFEAGAAYSLGGLVLGASARAGLEPGEAYGLALGLSASLLGERESALRGEALSLGLAARASYEGGAEGEEGGELGGELFLPLGLSSGGLGLGLGPGLRLALPLQSPEPRLAALLRGGLRLSGPSFSLGLSALAAFEGLEAGGLSGPGIEAALEGRLLLGSSPLLLSGALLASRPASGSPGLGFALGLGLFF